MHIGVNYTRIIRAFITFRDAPGGPPAYFNQLSEFTQIFGSAIYVTQTLVGDSVVLYRCYLVWSRDKTIILFPALLLLGSTACGVGILYSFAKVVPEAEIFVDQLQDWIVSFFSLTLATNLICTALVAYRIWYINHLASVFSIGSSSLRPIVLLVIESGMVYSLSLTALLILYKTHSWFQYVLLDAISPIVGSSNQTAHEVVHLRNHHSKTRSESSRTACATRQSDKGGDFLGLNSGNVTMGAGSV
ncbi:hypothetical protein K435DRAFT_781700 [Dendrothele bispora CBS 962.96]|uniref:Uncharacterized protein n=1 Tax=Dendrothele bispora (strain CBS 962.96) TaxID=1314807 RepID=A0A4S8LJB7_DENBC|nr:hypothetical protein K435DRAFT_781700 [Dendrothele bispora CBS 962.96]